MTAWFSDIIIYLSENFTYDQDLGCINIIILCRMSINECLVIGYDMISTKGYHP